MDYQPGKSVTHGLHPLVKLGWLAWGTIIVFASSSTAAPLIGMGLAIVLLWTAGVAPWRIPGKRVWLTLGLVIFATHSLSGSGGNPVFGPATDAGLTSGTRAAGRLLAVVLMSTLFVVTTDPVSLACGLMRAGLPYRWGFTLVTALRLAPIFRVEAHNVYQAQLVRGVAYDARGPRRWGLILRHLCLPLLVSALRTAHSLSLSMEGRAFGLHRHRTFLREVTVSRADVIAAFLLIASIPAAIWVNHL